MHARRGLRKIPDHPGHRDPIGLPNSIRQTRLSARQQGQDIAQPGRRAHEMPLSHPTTTEMSSLAAVLASMKPMPTAFHAHCLLLYFVKLF
jgi:hypothetical protein